MEAPNAAFAFLPFGLGRREELDLVAKRVGFTLKYPEGTYKYWRPVYSGPCPGCGGDSRMLCSWRPPGGLMLSCWSGGCGPGPKPAAEMKTELKTWKDTARAALRGAYESKLTKADREFAFLRRSAGSAIARKDKGAPATLTAEWRAVRKAWLSRHPECVRCNSRRQLTLDHIVPIVEAPEKMWQVSNFQTLCRACHVDKTTADRKRIVAEQKRVAPNGGGVFSDRDRAEDAVARMLNAGRRPLWRTATIEPEDRGRFFTARDIAKMATCSVDIASRAISAFGLGFPNGTKGPAAPSDTSAEAADKAVGQSAGQSCALDRSAADRVDAVVRAFVDGGRVLRAPGPRSWDAMGRKVFTIQQVADMAGCSKGTVANWLAANRGSVPRAADPLPLIHGEIKRRESAGHTFAWRGSGMLLRQLSSAERKQWTTAEDIAKVVRCNPRTVEAVLRKDFPHLARESRRRRDREFEPVPHRRSRRRANLDDA